MRCYNNIFLFAYSDAQPSGNNCGNCGTWLFLCRNISDNSIKCRQHYQRFYGRNVTFLAIAALGGIVTPQIVGFLADRIGMTAAILVLAFNAVGMLVMAAVNVGMKKRG